MRGAFLTSLFLKFFAVVLFVTSASISFANVEQKPSHASLPGNDYSADTESLELAQHCRARLEALKKERSHAHQLGQGNTFDHLASSAEELLHQLDKPKTDAEVSLLLGECRGILEKLQLTIKMRASSRKTTLNTPVNRLRQSPGHGSTLQHVASPNVQSKEKLSPLIDSDALPHDKQKDAHAPSTTIPSHHASRSFDDPFEHERF